MSAADPPSAVVRAAAGQEALDDDRARRGVELDDHAPVVDYQARSCRRGGRTMADVVGDDCRIGV